MFDPFPRICPQGGVLATPGYPVPLPFARTIVFIRRMYVTMTLQDYFPADLTLLGLRNLYSLVGKDSFLVNSSCVAAKDKILTKGKHYIVFDIPIKTDSKMTPIVLIDLFFYEGNIHLISEDINTRRVSIVSFCLECPESNCTRYLVDVNYFIDRLDAKAIKDYCGDCDDTKKKPSDESKHQHRHDDDLLEFDF